MKIYNRFTGKLIVKVKDIKALYRMDLRNANLYFTDLSHANLSHANLSDADLSHANLSCANLFDADLTYADLSHANLSRADLYGADLSHADLSGAIFNYADLAYANLSVKNIPINNHWFISELLLRKASTEAQKDFALRIRTQTDKCWEYFIKLALRNRVYKWAYKVLSQWPEAEEKINKERKYRSSKGNHNEKEKQS